MAKRDPDALLPLTPAMFYVLVALADGQTHGYAILKEVEQLTSGAVRLSTGTLYGIIKRLLADGLIREAVLALAVGIGANTAVFTIVNGVLMRALPYRNPHELVAIFEKLPEAPVPKFEFSPPDFAFIRGAVGSFTGMFAYRNQALELSGAA